MFLCKETVSAGSFPPHSLPVFSASGLNAEAMPGDIVILQNEDKRHMLWLTEQDASLVLNVW